jgi:hypothetical protein
VGGVVIKSIQLSITALLLFPSLSGCVTMMMGASLPGGVSVTKSAYDGTTEIYMNPGWANNDLSGTIKIGARKNSKMSANEVLLIVRNDMIKNFHFTVPNFFTKINGIETKLSPIDFKTQCEIGNQIDGAHCYQEYRVEMSFIEQMLASTDVQFKLILNENSYVEGSLKNSGMTTARSGLQDFVEKVKTELLHNQQSLTAK